MNYFRFFAKGLVHGAVDWSGHSKRRRQQLCGKLLILTYHSFCSHWPRGLFSSLPINRFEQQIKFLNSQFKLVSLEQGVKYLKEGYVDDRPWLAITIDDGFQDNYTLAWPVLQRYGVPATIFLATDFIDTRRPPWPTQLVEIIESTKANSIGFPFYGSLGSITERVMVARKLKIEWSKLPPLERFEMLSELRKHLSVKNNTRYFPLTWNQVRELRDSGTHFGSHTVYHSILPMVDSVVMLNEIQESRKRIEDELDQTCFQFAYPDGKHCEAARIALDSMGYHTGVTQDLGYNEFNTDKLALKRIEVPYNDTQASFRVRASLAHMSFRHILHAEKVATVFKK